MAAVVKSAPMSPGAGLSAVMTPAAAASLLKVHETTVPRWIQIGAPVERRRGPGRTGGSLVVPARLVAWRAARAQHSRGIASADLEAIGAGLLRAFTHALEGDAEPKWQMLGDRGSRAAVILAAAYVSIIVELTGKPPAGLPDSVQTLQRIAGLALLHPNYSGNEGAKS